MWQRVKQLNFLMLFKPQKLEANFDLPKTVSLKIVSPSQLNQNLRVTFIFVQIIQRSHFYIFYTQDYLLHVYKFLN